MLVRKLRERYSLAYLVLSLAQLHVRRLAAAICTRKRARTVRCAAVHHTSVEHLRTKRVASRNKHHAMVAELRDGGERSRLETATQRGYASKDTSGLADKLALLPELAGGVPEGLHLRRHHAIAGGDAKEKAVVLLKCGVKQDDCATNLQLGRNERVVNHGVVPLWRCVHLCKNVASESLCNLEHICLNAGSTCAVQLSMSQLAVG